MSQHHFNGNDINSSSQQQLQGGHHQTTSAPAPFHNLPPDCIHVILSYHIFQLHMQKNTLIMQELTPETQEWEFLQVYGHGCCLRVKNYYSNQEVPEDQQDTQLQPNNDSPPITLFQFLRDCRECDHKPHFQYLSFIHVEMPYFLIGEEAIGNAAVLRSVPEVDLSGTHFTRECHVDAHEKMELFLRNLRGIEKLSLRVLNSVSSSCFANLRNIRQLNLTDYHFDEAPNNAMENFRGVESLHLTCCKFPEKRKGLENLRGIRHLELSTCRSDNLSPEDFKQLGGIQSLRIDDGFVALTDEHMKYLRGVKEFHLYSFAFDSAHYSSLTDASFVNLRGIQKLSFSAQTIQEHITDEAFKNLRGVKELSLLSFPNITSKIFENLRGIESLTINDCPNIGFTADALRNLRGIKTLLHTYTRGPYNSRSGVIHHFVLDVETLKNLYGAEMLILSGVVTACDDAFCYLGSVTDLHLNGMNGLDQSAPLGDAAFSYLKNVNRLHLENMRLDRVTNFSSLCHRYMPRLTWLNVKDCRVLKSSLEPESDVELSCVRQSEGDEDGCVMATFHMSSY